MGNSKSSWVLASIFHLKSMMHLAQRGDLMSVIPVIVNRKSQVRPHYRIIDKANSCQHLQSILQSIRSWMRSNLRVHSSSLSHASLIINLYLIRGTESRNDT